jgi:hypothetical protein
MTTWRDGTETGRIASEFENSVVEYSWQIPTAFTNAAVTAAITTLGATGGVVRLMPGTYTFTAGVTVPRNVHIIGSGIEATTVTHSGNDAAFLCRDSDAFSTSPNRSVVGMKITGNSGSSAIGVDCGNSWGQLVRECVITGYTGGRAIRLLNSTYWTEGTSLENLMIRNSAIGIELARTDGTESFGYQRWRNVAISVPASGIGIDIGGASASEVYLYNSDLDCEIWLDGNSAVAVKIRAVANATDNRYHITGEMSGGYSSTIGLHNLGGTFVGYGRASINGASDTITLGTTLVRSHFEILDSGVTASSTTYKQITTSNIDNRYSGQFGIGTGSNIDLAYVAGYGGGGNEVFRVLSVPFDGTPATATKVLGIEPAGALVLVSGVKIHVGSGTPENAVVSPIGSLFLRTDGGAGTVLYVKESGSGNTGWNPIAG